MLRIENLSKSFTIHARSRRIVALDDVSLTVPAGALSVLTGPSGAGKSTVLKCVYRTYRPDAGRMLLDLDGETVDLATADDHRVLDLRRREIGFVTQFLHCLPRVPALDVVAEPLIHAGEDATAARARARELLAHLAVPEALWSLSPTTFSGGEKQRVNLARGFARRNRLLLLDEPTASLDPASAERVLELVAASKAAGTTLLAILHDPRLVARIADHELQLTAPVQEEEPACATS